jgi:hypothetical protein
LDRVRLRKGGPRRMKVERKVKQMGIQLPDFGRATY